MTEIQTVSFVQSLMVHYDPQQGAQEKFGNKVAARTVLVTAGRDNGYVPGPNGTLVPLDGESAVVMMP